MSSRKEPPSQLILFSQPRTGCHLLERMLSKQSCIHTYLQHPFGVSGRYQRQWLLAEPLTPIPDELRRKHEVQVRKGERSWREALHASRRVGKALYTHFHPFFTLRPEEVFDYLSNDPALDRTINARNPLSIHQDLLLQKGTVPLLTIRNPRLQVPSIYRLSASILPGAACRTETLASATGRWTRLLYDWYLAHGTQPLVFDADDYMSSEAFVRHLCGIAGLDPAEAFVRWDRIDTDEMEGRTERNHAAIQETLFASQGPEARRAAKNVDLEAEVRGWDVEFGHDTAEMLRGIVEAVTPEYEYLWERRVRTPVSKL